MKFTMQPLCIFLLAAAAFAQAPLTSPYQDYRHFGELDLRDARTYRTPRRLIAPTDGVVCLTPYERFFAYSDTRDHVCSPSSYSATEGVWATVGGSGGGGGATSLAGVNDFKTVRTSATLLTTNADAATNRVVGHVGEVPYGFSTAATVTLSGSGAAGTVYLAQRNDGVLTATHNSIGCTFTPSGYTMVTGTTYTGAPIATATITNCQLDALGVTDQRGFFGQGKKITVSGGLTKTETADTIDLAATATSSFDPMDASSVSVRFPFIMWGPSYTSLGVNQPWTLNCGGAGVLYSPTTNDPAGVGVTNAACWVYYQHYFGDIISGGTPKNWTFFYRGGRYNAGTTDIYMGATGSITTADNGVMIRYNTGAGTYSCVIRSAGGDVATTAITGATVDLLPHTYRVRNNGEANKGYCRIDSGTEVSVSGTIPSVSLTTFGAMPGASSTHVLAIEAGLKVTGLGR